MDEERREARKFGATVCLSIGGAVLAGGFMGLGTLLLGHVRPAWMEFDRTFTWAFGGLLIGGIVGFFLDSLRR